MGFWEECGNGSGWFALKMSDGIYMCSYETLETLYHESDSSVLTIEEVRNQALRLELWSRICR